MLVQTVPGREVVTVIGSFTGPYNLCIIQLYEVSGVNPVTSPCVSVPDTFTYHHTHSSVTH